MPKTSHITEEILQKLPSPCWLLEEHLLEENLKTLYHIKQQTGIKILLALKGFSFWQEADLIMKYLDGCCASGIHEARLAAETFGGEVHTYAPAYKEAEIASIAQYSHHMVFNAPAQLKRFAAHAKEANPRLSIGLRVNPEISHAPTALYDPCAPYSRLGTTASQLNLLSAADREMLDGLHLHALCEESADALESVLKLFEQRFGQLLDALQWVNFGGGHHITKEGYDSEKLIAVLNRFQNRYPHLKLYLEPGEAVGWETGPLVCTVLDIVHNGIDIAIVDSSAEAHMPDTIIMPYRAEVRGASEAGVKMHTYRLAGNTCLAGDMMGDYSFDTALKVGDKILFEDQMHYTMVKATTFNGITLPAIAILRHNKEAEILRKFDYTTFKNRLG